MFYLGALIILVYLVLANGAVGTDQSNYGNNSRAELFGRSVYFLVDYPFTGAGLKYIHGELAANRLWVDD